MNSPSERPPTMIPNQARPRPSFPDFGIRRRATQPQTTAAVDVTGFGMSEKSARYPDATAKPSRFTGSNQSRS